MTIALYDVGVANPGYFSSENIRFFGDINYRILHDKQGKPYLVRKTYAWTGMFGDDPIAHYRINPIGANLDILPLDDRTFATLAEVNTALRGATQRKARTLLLHGKRKAPM